MDIAPEGWTPYCPSALEPEDISVWPCGTTTLDFVHVEDVYAKGDNREVACIVPFLVVKFR